MGTKSRRINKGRVSRIGSYAIASSIKDPNCVSCTTFNILAPIYKRLNHEDSSYRESDVKDYWLDRNKRILDWLLCERSSIICLQEFWVGNEELVSIYDKRLGDAGYINFKLARTNNRGDGLLTAVHKDYFRIISHRELLFNDFGDRVAQLLHVELIAPFSQNRTNNVRQEILIVNTHLMFPHNSSLCLERLRQVYKILQYVESYQKENKLNPLPILLCGDWNGSKRGHVYKFLRSQGFVSSYDTAHQYTDADAHKWVSHRNHRGNICGVDFIWLLNPNRYRKLLKTSWREAVFGMFKYQLRRASLTEDDAFAFLKADSQGDYITYSGFCEALRLLKLIGHCNGLSDEEIQELWVQADIDGNGVLDYKEFKQRIWNASLSEQGVDENDESRGDVVHGTEQTIGFSVKNAVLFPTEVEKGMWPEDYSLSDHARLTVVFSPVRMPCSRLT
ncbi:Transcriptional effector CCR4-related protein [Handroanthus impetiginosus]|uniref:Transcriptional effector CCR4-related protein n=1 Tax=Handroanthus impetiginosus TaxID=429701 RepID=A0A2G9G0M0_9LAMI|nr:Transcriptional effector CCR4-related protein [Handroanthus impetiginosus]